MKFFNIFKSFDRKNLGLYVDQKSAFSDEKRPSYSKSTMTFFLIGIPPPDSIFLTWWYMVLIYFLILNLNRYMIELNFVTIDKDNKCTAWIHLVVIEFNLVSFSRRRGKSKCFWPTVIVFSVFLVRMMSLKQHTYFNTVGQYGHNPNGFESIVLR